MSTRKLSPQALAEALEEATGHTFRDPEPLRRALTHASARKSTGFDYERFEFLGDRVLGLVIADLLFRSFPDASEGELSLRFNALVNAETLAQISDKIGLPALVHVGAELKGSTGRKRVNLRADALEALIAALYLDGGMDVARAFVLRYWQPLSSRNIEARRDPKTALQEWAHQVAGKTPIYTLENRVGPDHDPVFTIRVNLETYEPTTGQGRTKREAEQAAAIKLLTREGVWKEGDAA